MRIRLSDLFIMLYPIWVLILVATSPIQKKSYFFLPLFLMVILYLYNLITIKQEFIFKNPYYYAKLNNKLKITWVILLFVLLIVITNNMLLYYTGIDIFLSLKNIFSGESNYNSYQEFYRENERNTFEPIKIFYNIVLATLKISAFYSVYMIFFLEKNKARYYLLALPLFFYALTRGTNIEFFDIFLYMSVAFIIKYKASKSKIRAKLTKNLLILVIGFISLFFYQIQLRYSFEYQVPSCNYDFCYDQSYPFNNIGPILYSITPYFLGGLVNVNLYFDNITLAYFIPFNADITGLSLSKFCSESITKCGPWKPLLISLVESVGLILTGLIYLLAPFAVKYFNKKINNQFIKSLFLYLYLYFLASGFMGGGIASSFSNYLLVVIVLIYYVKDDIKISFFKNNIKFNPNKYH